MSDRYVSHLSFYLHTPQRTTCMFWFTVARIQSLLNISCQLSAVKVSESVSDSLGVPLGTLDPSPPPHGRAKQDV